MKKRMAYIVILLFAAVCTLSGCGTSYELHGCETHKFKAVNLKGDLDQGLGKRYGTNGEVHIVNSLEELSSRYIGKHKYKEKFFKDSSLVFIVCSFSSPAPAKVFNLVSDAGVLHCVILHGDSGPAAAAYFRLLSIEVSKSVLEKYEMGETIFTQKGAGNGCGKF